MHHIVEHHQLATALRTCKTIAAIDVLFAERPVRLPLIVASLDARCVNLGEYVHEGQLQEFKAERKI